MQNPSAGRSHRGDVHLNFVIVVGWLFRRVLAMDRWATVERPQGLAQGHRNANDKYEARLEEAQSPQERRSPSDLFVENLHAWQIPCSNCSKRDENGRRAIIARGLIGIKEWWTSLVQYARIFGPSPSDTSGRHTVPGRSVRRIFDNRAFVGLQ